MPSIAKVKTKHCETCFQEKTFSAFNQLPAAKRPKGGGPQALEDTCKACLATLSADNLSQANSDRRQERIAERQLEKAKAKYIEQEARKAARDATTQAKEKRRLAAEKRHQLSLSSEARRELAERELARKSLLKFVKRFNPTYLAGWVHVDICNRLEKFLTDIEGGKSPRLMLFMPPRHGKSIIASQHFPPWVLGQHPDWEIIAASYGSSLPIKFSRHVRGLLREPAYHAIFPDVALDKENESAEGWMTTAGGGYLPAGVAGGITGKGAHILVIDDPIKDAEEADSETQREKVWDWYGSTAYSRLAPNSGVLVIQTRWHDDDLSGRLIAQMQERLRAIDEIGREMHEVLDAERGECGVEEYLYKEERVEQKIASLREEMDEWVIVNYPAIAEEDEWKTPEGETVLVDPKTGVNSTGEIIDFQEARLLRQKGQALHPARYPLVRLKKIKNTAQPRHWSALYQQNPVPDDGDMFKREDFVYEAEPPDVRGWPICIAWDLAIGLKKKNDWTVGTVCALDPQDRVHLVKMIRFRGRTGAIARAIVSEHKHWRKITNKPVVTGIERGQLEMAVSDELKRASKELSCYPNYDKELMPIQDKIVRAAPLQGRTQQKTVILPNPDPMRNPWVETVIHELLRFPNGVFDDIVDSLSWNVRCIARNLTPPKTGPRSKKVKSWRDELKKHIAAGSKRDPMAA